MSSNFTCTCVADRRPTRPAAGDNLTIGQVSRLTGLDAKTMRYYESIGLLPRPPRQANNYRRYGAADVNRLLLLQRIRLLGVPLSEAKQFLAGATDARCADVQDALVALVNDRLLALDREIAELHALRTQIEGYRDSLTTCRADESESFSACNDVSCIVGNAGVAEYEEEDHACCIRDL
jgi:DNA-binding transcriptional MerR regulator